MRFQIKSLPIQPFAPLFALPAEQLGAHLATRLTATFHPGFPCRVSLQDAEIGEDMLLVNYRHQPAASPFQAAHAIYVRTAAIQAHPDIGEIPPMLSSRHVSVRAFDSAGTLRAAELAAGTELAPCIERLLAPTHHAYLHIHFAAPGCYAARVDRA